jgi:hypothetical protein
MPDPLGSHLNHELGAPALAERLEGFLDLIQEWRPWTTTKSSPVAAILASFAKGAILQCSDSPNWEVTVASIDRESELDRLYSSPLADFVKIRNDLAGLLKKEGDEEGAAEVASLKKPSVSAWVVNQLGHAAQLELQRLVNAGEAMERAQRQSMSGGDSGGFADARKDEAATISRLRTAAKKILPSASPAILDRVTNTLRAGSATSEGRDLIKKGRLTEDLDPPGFEAFSGLPMATPAAKPPRPTAATKASARIATIQRRKREAEENTRELSAKADDLEEAAAAAEELAKKAANAAAKARKMAESARVELERLAAEQKDLE